ncbi:MAG: acyl-ACP--UDP-N-acetylglucosamine O-acyltransferase [Deltaproteobacteria bacterium]|nr:acyl-ACP--UDP-N-acetylglucosamine O-acyltransferase [Deltaproteobacteria bacterium]
MSEKIHPLAQIDRRARLGPDVSIGAFAIVGPDVELDSGAIVHPHAIVDGNTTIGPDCEIFPFAAVGLRPQDKKYDGSKTRLIVGAKTIIREGATLQPGTVQGGGVTRVGGGCLVMAYAHVAHDCSIGDRVILANATQIAGHCTIEDDAILGGVTTVHQFVRIGHRAITGASSRVVKDVPPYFLADGHPARLFGPNTVGLRRAGISSEARLALKRAYKDIFVRGSFRAGLDQVEARAETDEVKEVCAFLRASQRGVTPASRRRAKEDDEG